MEEKIFSMTVSDNVMREKRWIQITGFAQEMKIGKKKSIENLTLDALKMISLIPTEMLLNFLDNLTLHLEFVPINKFNFYYL